MREVQSCILMQQAFTVLLGCTYILLGCTIITSFFVCHVRFFIWRFILKLGAKSPLSINVFLHVSRSSINIHDCYIQGTKSSRQYQSVSTSHKIQSVVPCSRIDLLQLRPTIDSINTRRKYEYDTSKRNLPCSYGVGVRACISNASQKMWQCKFVLFSHVES